MEMRRGGLKEKEDEEKKKRERGGEGRWALFTGVIVVFIKTVIQVNQISHKWQLINRLDQFFLSLGIWELEVEFISLLEAVLTHAA